MILKLRYVAVFLIVMTSGCSQSGGDGKSSCNSPLVGTWRSAGSDMLSLNSDLSFELKGGDGCQSGGSGSCPGQITNGTIKLSIEYSSGGICLPAGDYVCSFDLQNNTRLSQNCGYGTLVYYRQ